MKKDALVTVDQNKARIARVREKTARGIQGVFETVGKEEDVPARAIADDTARQIAKKLPVKTRTVVEVVEVERTVYVPVPVVVERIAKQKPLPPTSNTSASLVALKKPEVKQVKRPKMKMGRGVSGFSDAGQNIWTNTDSDRQFKGQLRDLVRLGSGCIGVLVVAAVVVSQFFSPPPNPTKEIPRLSPITQPVFPEATRTSAPRIKATCVDFPPSSERDMFLRQKPDAYVNSENSNKVCWPK